MPLAESLDPDKLEARRQTRWAWKLGGATLVLAIAGFIGVLVFYDIAPQSAGYRQAYHGIPPSLP